MQQIVQPESIPLALMRKRGKDALLMIHNNLRLSVPWGRATSCRCFAHYSVMKFNIWPILPTAQPGRCRVSEARICPLVF